MSCKKLLSITLFFFTVLAQAGDASFHFGSGAQLIFYGGGILFQTAGPDVSSRILLKGKVQYFITPKTQTNGVDQYASFRDGEWVVDRSRGDTFMGAIPLGRYGSSSDRYTFVVVESVVYAIDETGKVTEISKLSEESAFRNRKLWSVLRANRQKPARISSHFLPLHFRDTQTFSVAEGPLLKDKSGSWDAHYFVRSFASSGNPFGPLNLLVQEFLRPESVRLSDFDALETYVQESPVVVEGLVHWFALLDQSRAAIGIVMPQAGAQVLEAEIRNLPLSESAVDQGLDAAHEVLSRMGLSRFFTVHRSSVRRALYNLPSRHFEQDSDMMPFLQEYIGRLIADAVLLEKFRAGPPLDSGWPVPKALFIDNPCSQIVDTDFKMVD